MLILLAAGCGKAELYHHLSEKEANEFIVTLAGAGIAAQKQPEPVERGEPTYMISVPKDKLDLAFHVLETYGLPKKKGLGIAAVYPGGGLIPGQFEERAKYLLALTGELEVTLRSIERVVDARVHVVIPEEAILKDEDEGTVRPSASVLLKYIPTADGKKPIEDVDVKQLVWRAIEGLNLNDITVVTIPVKSPTAGHAASGEAAALPGVEMSAEQCMEKYKDVFVDKVSLWKVGPIGVAKDSYRYFLGVLGALAGVTLVFFVLWLVAFLQASSLRKKLANLQKAKAKKPTTSP